MTTIAYDVALSGSAIDAGPDGGPPVSLTNTAGRAFFFGTSPGSVTLTATAAGVGRVSQNSVNTAPNAIVQVGMPPTP